MPLAIVVTQQSKSDGSSFVNSWKIKCKLLTNRGDAERH